MVFALLVGFHVGSGVVCALSGVVAMLSKKHRGRHSQLGRVYFWSFCGVFVTAAGLAAFHWSADWYIFAVGAAGFSSATLGFAAEKVRWHGWRAAHICGMGLSYIGLLTAFYIDNGPHLPVLRLLPPLVFWLVPSLVGAPLIVRVLARHRVLAASKDRRLEDRLQVLG